MAFRMDVTMMYAIHAVLRRELARIVRMAAPMDDDPQCMLRAFPGWERFKIYLPHPPHRQGRDGLACNGVAADRSPDDLALFAAMEFERVAIDPHAERHRHRTGRPQLRGAPAQRSG
jgi:hypothetical protein